MIVREKDITVGNPLGVHGRVATQLALLARRHGVLLHLLHADEEIDCSSVLDVLSMALTCGSVFRVRVAGEEDSVVKTLAAVEQIFGAAGKV